MLFAVGGMVRNAAISIGVDPISHNYRSIQGTGAWASYADEMVEAPAASTFVISSQRWKLQFGLTTEVVEVGLVPPDRVPTGAIGAAKLYQASQTWMVGDPRAYASCLVGK